MHAAYRLNPNLEVLLRHYDGKSEQNRASTGLTNTNIGITAHLVREGRAHVRWHAQYISAGGDTSGYTGVRGFRDDTVVVELQFYIEKPR